MAVRIIGCLVFWQTRDPRSRRPLSHFGRCWQNSSRKSILCGSFGFCQILSAMGRPAKTLLERVLAGSFRPDRYGSLLAGKLLPKTSPFSDRFRRRIWQDLREAQQEYQEAVASKVFSADWHRAVCARAFSKSVRALHGGRPPSWTRAKPMNPRLYRRRLERILAELPSR